MMNSIDRLDKSIESISLGHRIAMTTTHGLAGIF